MQSLLQHANPAILSLSPYQPGKPIDELERELGISNIVKLASNENPLGPSPHGLAAANRTMAECHLYPDGGGFQLRQKLAARHQVDMAQITLGNGSSDLLEFVVRSFVTPADEVLFSQYSFAIYPLVTQAAGGIGIAAPARHWGHDLTAMAERITPRTRVIFIANPNNPTGTWLDGDSLQAFLAQVPPSVIVVMDEAYFEYAHYPAMGAAGYPDTIPWIARYPNLVVTRTFSKAFGLAGLRVGYAISHPTIADLLNRVRPPFNVNAPALAAATAALDDHEHLEISLAENHKGMLKLQQAVAAMGLTAIPSVTNFICMDMAQPARPLYDALLREGVIVRPVANYSMPNHLRVTVGTLEQNQRFIAALQRVLG
jgi:histidinol-phosphate aminotransferase